MSGAPKVFATKIRHDLSHFKIVYHLQSKWQKPVSSFSRTVWAKPARNWHQKLILTQRNTSAKTRTSKECCPLGRLSRTGVSRHALCPSTRVYVSHPSSAASVRSGRRVFFFFFSGGEAKRKREEGTLWSSVSLWSPHNRHSWNILGVYGLCGFRWVCQ